MRVKALFEFNGSRYSGWQIQSDSITVQGEIEKSLSCLCNRQIKIVGAGRTDAGVHAKNMPVHFDIEENEFLRIKKGLNRVLPIDIACQSVLRVSEKFHARFDAVMRSYDYCIGKGRHPLRGRFEYQHKISSLNVESMQLAAKYSVGHANWRGFAREGGGNSTWDINVLDALVIPTENGWTFTIKANRFLRGVVRIWSGTILQIGFDRIPPETIKTILATTEKKYAGASLPACGLTLMEVTYPDEIF